MAKRATGVATPTAGTTTGGRTNPYDTFDQDACFESEEHKKQVKELILRVSQEQNWRSMEQTIAALIQLDPWYGFIIMRLIQRFGRIYNGDAVVEIKNDPKDPSKGTRQVHMRVPVPINTAAVCYEDNQLHFITNPEFWAWLTLTNVNEVPPYRSDGYNDTEFKQLFEEKLKSTLWRRMGLVKHEAIHIILSHLTRGIHGIDRSKMEIAKEIEDNQWVADSWLFPEDPTPEKFGLPEKLTCEQYYKILPEPPPGTGQSNEQSMSFLIQLIMQPQPQSGQGQGNQQQNQEGKDGDNSQPNNRKGKGNSSPDEEEKQDDGEGDGSGGQDDKDDDNGDGDQDGQGGGGKDGDNQQDDSDGDEQGQGGGSGGGRQRPSRSPFDGLNGLTKDNHDAHQSHEQAQSEKPDDPLSGSNQNESIEGLVEAIIRDITEQMRDSEKHRGLIPGLANELYNKIAAKAQIPWERILENLMSDMVESQIRRSFRRPSRRNEDIFPSRRRRYKYRYALATDESGSVSDLEFATFCIEIDRIVEVNESGVRWLHTDASVDSLEEYEAWSPRWNRRRTGGTDFQPTIDYCIEHNITDVIYFTDGQGPIPDSKGINILWVFTPGMTPESGCWTSGKTLNDFPGRKLYMKPSKEQLEAAKSRLQLIGHQTNDDDE